MTDYSKENIELALKNDALERELAAAHQEIAALKVDAVPVAWRINGPHTDTYPFTENPAYAAKFNGVPLYLHPPTEDKRDAMTFDEWWKVSMSSTYSSYEKRIAEKAWHAAMTKDGRR